MERNYKLDNIKVLLIFFVVFGHLLEICKSQSVISESIYLIIYSFHMAAFIFINGIFAKFNKKQIFGIFFAYLIFQPLYRINPYTTYSVDYYRPHWILWYLFNYGIYTLLIPIFNVKSKSSKITLLIGSVIFSLMAGFFDNFGYNFSLSRIFVYFPFFLAGLYIKDYLSKINDILLNKKVYFATTLAAFLICTISSIYIVLSKNIVAEMLYGAFSYNKILNYNFGIRFLLLSTGFFWIILLYLIIPNKKIKFVSEIGKYTLPIYLLHGFIVAILSITPIFNFDVFVDILVCLLISLLLIVLFGNKYVGPILKKLFTGEYILKILDLSHNKISKNFQ